MGGIKMFEIDKKARRLSQSEKKPIFK